MVNCLHCGDVASVGSLCATHGDELASSCRDITAGQILGRPIEQPKGWLVDQWGRIHPLNDGTMVGRSYAECSFAIMHHSVSSRHARVSVDDNQVHIVDTGSLNGTYINQTRMREAHLQARDLVTFGEISFYFMTRVTALSDLPYGIGGTVPVKKSGFLPLAVELRKNDRTALLLQRGDGGVIRCNDNSLDLAQLEFSLLRALVEEAMAAKHPDFHFMSTQALLHALDFRTLAPTSENLRELVRRLRRKLMQIGIDEIIESKRGVGYRLNWSVDRAMASGLHGGQ